MILLMSGNKDTSVVLVFFLSPLPPLPGTSCCSSFSWVSRQQFETHLSWPWQFSVCLGWYLQVLQTYLGGPTVGSALVTNSPTFFVFPCFSSCPLSFLYNSVSSNILLFQFSVLELFSLRFCKLLFPSLCLYPSSILPSSQQHNWSPLQQIKFILHKFTFRAWPVHSFPVWSHFFPSCWLHVVICSSPGALLVLAFLSPLL